MPPHDGQTKRAVLVGVADRVSDLGRPGFVQAAEQLDWPFVVGEIGEHVGKADAVGIDDERHRATRRLAPRVKSATFCTCSRVSSDLAWETSMILA
jgi:hypothetical protein